MMKKTEKLKTDRRRALRSLASTPALAAAAVVASRTGPAEAAPAVEAAAPTAAKGYQETQHVRDYYRTAG